MNTAANPSMPSALQATPNIQFNPAPTAGDKCSKLKVNILLDSTTYVAGGNLNGRLELQCSSNRSIKLGEIAVELTGFEEVTDRDHGASQSFLSARIVFQGIQKPPTNAVKGQAEGGYWQAVKGKTTFPFSFRLPIDAPSWYTFQNVASLRYVVTAHVQFQQNGKNGTVIRHKDACVYEYWKANHPDIRNEPIHVHNRRKVLLGGPGEVHLEGAIKTSFFRSGNDVYVEVRVRNESKRRVSGIRLSIVRRLLMGREGTAIVDFADGVKVISETVHEETFREKDYTFDPGENRSTVLHVTIPAHVRTVRNTALAAVACRLIVALQMGTFTKDLTIDLPIDVCHSASLLPPPEADMFANSHPQQYNLMAETEDAYPSEREPRATRPRRPVPTARMRSASPVMTHENMVGSPPKGVRALPWSDDEDDAEQFHRNRREQKARGEIQDEFIGSHSPNVGPSSPLRPVGGLLREVSPGTPPTVARLGIRTKGVYAKSPLVGPTSPNTYVPATIRSRHIEKHSVRLDAPTSPSQVYEVFGSPAAHNGNPRMIDPIALPSPVMAPVSPVPVPVSPHRRVFTPAFELQRNGFFDPPSHLVHQHEHEIEQVAEQQSITQQLHQHSVFHQSQQQPVPAARPQHRQSRPLPPIPNPMPEVIPAPANYAPIGFGYFFDKARQMVSYAAGPYWGMPEGEAPPNPQPNAPSPHPHPESGDEYPNYPSSPPAPPSIPIPTSPYHSPHLHASHQLGNVPAQYLGMSPPLSPRPAGYVSKWRREAKPLPPQPVPQLPQAAPRAEHQPQKYDRSQRTVGFADERPRLGQLPATDPKPSMKVEIVHVTAKGDTQLGKETEAPTLEVRRARRYSHDSEISQVSDILGKEVSYLEVDGEEIFEFSDVENPRVSTMKTRNHKKRPPLDAVINPNNAQKQPDQSNGRLGTKARSGDTNKAPAARENAAATSSTKTTVPSYARQTLASAAGSRAPPPRQTSNAGPSNGSASRPVNIKPKTGPAGGKSTALSPKLNLSEYPIWRFKSFGRCR
ncbi:hypothetical protein HDV00_001664 [Rhizophlyctis rosea]|nr:hypothetical protein HDV00_001664 [Rhizophlyctis rosea]